MRKIIIVSLVVLAFIAFAFCRIAFANCGMCMTESVEEGEVINDTCPVMGGKVDKDTSYKTVYEGKAIGFCCPGCIEKFKADPEKYMAKLEKKCIIKCPECGAEIDAMEQCKKMGVKCPMMKKMQPAEEKEKTHEGHTH